VVAVVAAVLLLVVISGGVCRHTAHKTGEGGRHPGLLLVVASFDSMHSALALVLHPPAPPPPCAKRTGVELEVESHWLEENTYAVPVRQNKRKNRP
jgi:hypothetical protein